MGNKVIHLFTAAALGIAVLLAFPSSALADGGPVLSDPQLWASLKESQQTAVISLERDSTARIDLFVSMLDDTSESHKITYFVPLGREASNFQVSERSSLEFDQKETQYLDAALSKRAHDKNNMRLYLFGAMSAISGGWALPLSIPFLLAGCAAPTPQATFQTESSSVSIYSLDQDTNLEDLINTTGLDPSVIQTLSRLKGQRIAVITLQTQPQITDPRSSSYYGSAGQPGIHLSWTTGLTGGSVKGNYSYPLGTGSAWSHPISLTRVYVVSPPGLDFTVHYPKLGADRSGYNLAFIFGQDTPRIMGHYDTPSYAIDEASGSFGRIWRATYSQSNSSENIIVETGSQGILIRARQSLAGLGGFPSLLIGLLVAAALWVAAWRYVMPRVVGFSYKWRQPKLWGDALVCFAINAGSVAVAVPVAVVVFLVCAFMGGWFVGAPLAMIIILPPLFGVPAIWLYVRRQWWYTEWPGTDVSWHRTIGAYVLVAVVANVAYLVFAFGYAVLAGIL